MTATAQTMAQAIGVGGAEMGQRSKRVTTSSPSTAVQKLSTESLSSEGTWSPTFGVAGLDVSGHQTNIDWQQQWNMGARFAYVKASEGNYFTNDQFNSQYQGSRNVGMIRGAYHFAIPNWSSGADQARYFVANGGGWTADGYTMPPVLDFEFNPYAGRTDIPGYTPGNTCYSMSPDQLASWVRDFGNTMQALTGRLPVIYTNTSWWNQCLGTQTGFGDYPLWVAAYPSSPSNDAGAVPAGWSNYSIWQYSSTGPFAGDSNVWNGDYASLKTFASQGGDVARAVQRAAEAAQPWLGSPWGAIACGLVQNGCYQIYQGGTVLWSPTTGANVLRSGAIRGSYQMVGAENSTLGFPVMGPEVCGLAQGGCYQMFQGGAILWNAVTGAQISLWGPIRDRYSTLGFENGVLGYPNSGQYCGLKNGGCYQMFQNGAILWSPATGAQPSTFGGIRSTYASFGFENGRPGYPTSPEYCGSINGGCYQMFEAGAIVWGPGTGAYYSPFGAIRGVWGAQGFEYGWMGYPLSSETCSTATSCYQVFQGAVLTWTAGAGVTVTRR